MTENTRTPFAGRHFAGKVTTSCIVLMMASSAMGQSGAVFHVSGPATTGASGMWGDAILDSVEFPTGDVFTEFITAKAIMDFNCSSTFSGLGWSVSSGTDCTTGATGWFRIEDEDGSPSTVSDADRAAFSARVLDTLNDRNLNSLVHLKSDDVSFIIEFNQLVRDNDTELDDFGEILYFERGAGAGNSDCYLQAVDEYGVALGPLVIVDGDETLPTTPLVTIGTPWATHLTNQTMGGATIDLTRLGVEELRYLKVFNQSGDPDLKIFAVWTQDRQPDPVEIFD